MTELREKSVAFQQALLKSERLRILIVLGAIAAAFSLRTIRTAILFNREDFRLWMLSSLVLALFVGYECWMLRAVQRAIAASGDIAKLTWIINVLVETSLPALAVAFVTSASIDPAYRALANPAVLIFFVFIILSTLRLNPAASALSGIVAAVSYLAAAMYLGWKPTLGGGASLLSPQKTVFSYALTMVVAGVVAGAVAREIRKQVEAALREAELQRQVDKLEHDLEVARSIQQSLLPSSMPEIAGFDIAGWNQPADQTGGDYYDWQLLPDGRVLVVLADVTGHGIPSALLAVICRAYERANFTGENELLIAMERINAALSADLMEGRFVTFVAAVCGPNSSRVELLSAGHGPLFLYLLKEDSFDAMDAQGLPLGISPVLISEPPLNLELNPGDLLVLATDGFFEWANAQDEQFGTKRLQETVRSARDKSSREIISTLYKAVVEFSGGTKQQDDLTAVVIKRT
ncbi:MAG: PP2C family protein-serine/threonine phosphatase [Candidatus Acidiferrales bacterium]